MAVGVAQRPLVVLPTTVYVAPGMIFLPPSVVIVLLLAPAATLSVVVVPVYDDVMLSAAPPVYGLLLASRSTRLIVAGL